MNDREGPKAERRERSLRATGEHHVGVAIANGAKRIADRDRAGGAAHAVGGVRALCAEFDGDVAARCAAENVECERGIHRLDPIGQKDAELQFGEADAAKRAAHHDANALTILSGEIDARVFECLTCARDRERAEAVESFCLLRLDEIQRVEVIDLGSVTAPPHRGMEPRYGGHGPALAAKSIPQPFAPQSDGRYSPNSRHSHTPTFSHCHPPRDHSILPQHVQVLRFAQDDKLCSPVFLSDSPTHFRLPAPKASRSACFASPSSVRLAMPCTNTGPITSVAAAPPTRGTDGPFHRCRMRTCVPCDVSPNVHSTSMPLVTPAMCVYRMLGDAPLNGACTCIFERHQVGH